MDAELKIIVRALEQARKNTFFLLIMMGVLTLSIPFLALIQLERHVVIYYVLIITALLFFGGITLMLGLSYRKLMDLGQSPIMAAINTPGRIVWFYAREGTGRGSGNIQHLFLYMNDGKHENFSVANDDVPPLLEALEKKLPQAVSGFSKENQKLYKSDPGTFGKKTS